VNHSVVDALPSSSVSVSRLRTFSNTGAAILAAMASGVLLALPYNFPSLYLLTWVAFVPLLWVTRMSSLKQAYGLGFCAGLAMYVIGAFWIVDFLELYLGLGSGRSVILAVAFWLYCAQLLALLLLLYRWLRLHTGLSELVLFPPLVAMFYSGFPMLFSAPLGGSQSYFLVALQATEFFGAASLDFIIALTNVLLFVGLRVFLRLRVWQPSEARSVAVLTSSSGVWMAALLIVSWLSYGIYAVPRWDAAVAHWPVQAIGIVQPNETPSEQLPLPTPGYSWAYPPEMALTEKLAQAGAAVIVWPETRYKRYFADPHVEQAFAAKVAKLGVPLMFQDIEALGQGRDKKQYNTSVYLNAEGELAGKYRKVKRVPLGEYVPGLQHVEPFRDWLYHNLPAFFADFLPGETPAGRIRHGAFDLL
jgi:apolipoprotein N-acyltransferase